MNKSSLSRNVLTAAGLLTAAGVVLAITQATPVAQANDQQGNFNHLPQTLVLTGVIRDFHERTEPNGHPDFERRPAAGFGHYMGNVALQLDSDKKPVFTGNGKRVNQQWHDAQGNPIHPRFFDSSKGDVAGSWGVSDPGGIQSAESFRQWFRDYPGVNISKEHSITLRREAGSNMYVFDDREDPNYSALGGFFPINNDLFGNSKGNNRNYHFTYELSTTFVYEPGAGQTFSFIGDDDVWVFINGELVIDIGGVHSAIRQTVHLDRLDFLKANRENTLHFFFAERHRTEANFRIETTINLRNAQLPNSAHLYD